MFAGNDPCDGGIIVITGTKAGGRLDGAPGTGRGGMAGIVGRAKGSARATSGESS